MEADNAATQVAEVTTKSPIPASTKKLGGTLAGIGRLLGRGPAAWLAFGVVGSILGGIVELAVALLLQLFLASIGLLPADVRPSKTLSGLQFGPGTLVVSLVLIALVRAVGQFLVSQSSVHVLEVTNARLRRLVVFELLLSPARRFLPAAVVHARFSDVFPRGAQFCFLAASLVAQSIQTGVIGVVMFATAWRETLIGLAGLGVVGLLTLRINRKIREIGGKIPDEQLKLTEAVERVARNMLLIRTLRTQDREHGRFASAIHNYARHSIRAYMLNNLAAAMTPFAGLLLVTAIIVVSQRYISTPSLALLSFLYLFVRFVQGVAACVSISGHANHYWPQFVEALEYSERFSGADREVAFRDMSEIARAVDARRVARDGADAAPPAIEIDDVTFAHPGREEPAVERVSMTVTAGQFVAITGPSGSGKSTLLALLLGLLDPQKGSIRVEGRLARDYFDDARTRVGYVGAEPFLVAGTLRENASYGQSDDVTDEAIWEALEGARLAETVRQLPGKLTYRINEDGSGLSAGQKQRLCLARALLQKPHVLVLDEVSANLDDVTEREIALTLSQLKGSCTMVVVSHRPGLIEFADQRVVLGG